MVLMCEKEKKCSAILLHLKKHFMMRIKETHILSNTVP